MPTGRTNLYCPVGIFVWFLVSARPERSFAADTISSMTDVPQLTDEQAQMLREVIAWTRPQITHVVELLLAGGPVARADIESLRTSLGYELYASGVDGDYEPNARGRAIEALIDVLGVRAQSASF